MFKNLKIKIIHYLGGYTKEDIINTYTRGKLDAYEIVKTKAKELYGLPADEWCTLLYNHIIWLINEAKNKI